MAGRRRGIIQKVEGNSVNVGNFNPDNGLNVNYWNPTERNGNLWVAPLVVFIQNKV